MSSTDQYEIQFIWPSTSPQKVIVTGTFDNWTASLRLNKTSTGFEVKTRVPWGEKVKYKFIVDGEWRLRDDRPTEVDYGGYVNNVLTTPQKPAAVDTSVTDESQAKVLNGNGNRHAAAAPSKLELDAPVENGTAKPVNGDVKVHKSQDSQPANGTRFLSDLASTIAARDGTSTAIGYVASGLGAAMQSVVGVDPINTQKIAIPTPKVDEMFTLSDGQEPVSNSTDFEHEYPVLETSSHSPTSPVAPIVPIMIVPVNASENNTIPRETFNPEIDSQVQIPVISAKAPSPASDTTAAPIAVSEAEPAPAVADISVEAETTSKEEVASDAPAISNASDVPEAIAPVSTVVVENTSTPPPVAEVEIVEGAVLVKTGQTDELASAVPQVANEASSQEAEQKADVPVSVEATPAVTEASKIATPEEGAPATKEKSAPSTSEPVKGEETKEEAVATEAASTTTTVSEIKTSPPSALPITSVQQPSAPEPTTPTKSKFPSVSQQSSPSGSPASSKFGSTKRQKRASILHKLKEIFHHDKEKPEKAKK